MKPQPPLNWPARLAVAAMLILGLLGGSLVLAHAGFETSPRRGGTSTFVPLPQAWVMVAVMYGMSVVALLALLRDLRVGRQVHWLAWAVYGGVASGVVWVMGW